MPTFHEAEEIKQAQVRELLRVREKYDAAMANSKELNVSTAELIKMPFGIAQTESGRPTGVGSKPASASQSAFHKTTASTDTINSGLGKPGLMVSGIAFVLALGLLFIWLRRLWE